MSLEQTKRIAYDLALEYTRQHLILSDVESNIPKMVEHFAEICEKFEDSLKQSTKMQSLF